MKSVAISELIRTHLPVGSLRARIAKGTFWTLIGNLAAQVAGLLGTIFCARILGKAGFGELGMIRSTVLMFGVLAGTGLGMAATKYVAEFRGKDPLKAGRMIGLFMNTAWVLGGGVSVLCLIIAVPLAKWALEAPHLGSALQVGSLLLLLNTLNGVQLGAVCGFEAFRTQSRVIVLDGVFNVILIPVGAYIYGVVGAVTGLVMTALLGFFVKQRAIHEMCRRSAIKIVHRGVATELSTLWSFVFPAVLIGASIQPFEWISRLMLVRQPNGYAELGIFTAVFAWAQLILFLPGQVSGPIMPILSNFLGSGQIERLRKVIISSQLIVLVLALITALPLVFLAPYILRSYGSDFLSGRLTLLIMTGAYVVGVVPLITRSYFAASDRMWWQTFLTVIWGFLLVVGCKFLIHYGGSGLAFSYLAAYVIFTILQLGSQFIVMAKAREQIS